jgi:Uncharacterized conserved protein
MIVRGRGISKGTGSGPVLISAAPISFLSGVDPDTGIIVEIGHPLQGKSISGTVLVFPYGKGSTVGSYIIYALVQNGHAPAAIINREAEPIIAVGAIISGVPMIDRVDIDNPGFRDGIVATVNGDTGELEYEPEAVSGPPA